MQPLTPHVLEIGRLCDVGLPEGKTEGGIVPLVNAPGSDASDVVYVQVPQSDTGADGIVALNQNAAANRVLVRVVGDLQTLDRPVALVAERQGAVNGAAPR